MKLTQKHLNRLHVIIDMSIDRASRILSKTLKTAAVIKITNTSLCNACAISEKLNEDEREMVASQILLHGTGNGKVLFMVEKQFALILKDLYLQESVGTTTHYDAYAESTIQEIGNVVAGAISNSLAADLGLTILPTPPVVGCDYAGVIFSSMIMDDLLQDDELLLMDTLFEIMHYNFNCYFYFIPGKRIVESLDDNHIF